MLQEIEDKPGHFFGIRQLVTGATKYRGWLLRVLFDARHARACEADEHSL
jgi:hypothetical protein